MDMDHGDEEELPMQIGDSVSILSFPMKRRMDAGHDFFREGDIECSLVRRDMECTKEEIDQLLDIVSTRFQCNIKGCKDFFENISLYEMHYKNRHQNVCNECNRLLPTSHLLDLHIDELHNPLFDEKSETQLMYKCYIESCATLSKNGDERKEHLIKVHKYPVNYRFNKILKNKKIKNDVHKENVNLHSYINDASKTRAFSYKIPENIQFGHGQPKAFGKKVVEFKSFGQCHSKVNSNSMNMSELHDALVNK